MKIDNPKPSFFHALTCISGIFIMVLCGAFILKITLHSIILISILWVTMNAYYLDSNIHLLKKSIKSSLQNSLFILFIFILIGAVISAFIISGAIPTLVYYGLDFISPKAFLPVGMLLCSMMSLAIGSCWGTIGTMGVALMGVAHIFHIPLPLTAGMIVSGAYFGDKFSPISDTTILSAHSTNTNLYKHIKGMLYSILPAYLISLIIFWIIGSNVSIDDSVKSDELSSIQQVIKTQFHIGFLTLLPMFTMLFLSLKRKPAEISMLCSVIVALFVATLIQHLALTTAFNVIVFGPILQKTGSPILDAALNHGGMQSMLWPMSLTLLILILGGLLTTYQFITVLFEHIIRHLKHPTSLVFTTLSTSVFCNLLLGEAYLTIMLTSRIFKQAFHDLGLDSCVLSKSIEEGSTFSTPLIPWTTSGVFIFTTLGIAPFDYMFWSVFNWIAPLTFLMFVKTDFIGIKMYKHHDWSLDKPRSNTSPSP